MIWSGALVALEMEDVRPHIAGATAAAQPRISSESAQAQDRRRILRLGEDDRRTAAIKAACARGFSRSTVGTEVTQHKPIQRESCEAKSPPGKMSAELGFFSVLLVEPE